MSKTIGIGLVGILIGIMGIAIIYSVPASYRTGYDVAAVVVILFILFISGLAVTIKGIHTHRWLR